MIRFNTGIGNVNLRLKKIDEALKWHYKAISLMQTDGLKATCSFVYINLALLIIIYIQKIKQKKMKIQ